MEWHKKCAVVISDSKFCKNKTTKNKTKNNNNKKTTTWVWVQLLAISSMDPISTTNVMGLVHS